MKHAKAASQERDTRESRRLTYFIKAAETVQRALTEPDLKAIGITYVQFALLRSIESDPKASAAELARRIGITPQSVGEVIAALLRKGYIERYEDDVTRRIWRLSVLPAGKTILERAEGLLDVIEAEWTRGIDPAALHQVKLVLGQLIRHPQRSDRRD